MNDDLDEFFDLVGSDFEDWVCPGPKTCEQLMNSTRTASVVHTTEDNVDIPIAQVKKCRICKKVFMIYAKQKDFPTPDIREIGT